MTDLRALRTGPLGRLFLVLLCTTTGCLEPASERAERDREVGRADTASAAIEVDRGLATVQTADDGTLDLWAQAPDFTVDFETDEEAPTTWEITVQNAMPDAEFTATGEDNEQFDVVERRERTPTTIAWTVELPAGESTSLRIAPPDADKPEEFRFALLSDIQRDVGRVDDFWKRMNRDEEIRFVVSTGDLTQRGTLRELTRFRQTLRRLDVPFYTTIGNHELGESADSGFHEFFGRVNFQFYFKETVFTFLDSASATIDPTVYDWLERWIDRAGDDLHVFLTHVPPIDPIGTRNGSFRSRNEAQKLLNMLTRGGVDLGLYGHLHSYYAESKADIPMFISGGGGAIPEHFDGIERHYLTIDVLPGERIDQVGLVQIDDS
ncbi:MAG: metallophosphoesterase family protein [Persicimonas sp.]